MIFIRLAARATFTVWQLWRQQWALLTEEAQAKAVADLPDAEVSIRALEQALEERRRGGIRRAAIGAYEVHRQIDEHHKRQEHNKQIKNGTP